MRGQTPWGTIALALTVGLLAFGLSAAGGEPRVERVEPARVRRASASSDPTHRLNRGWSESDTGDATTNWSLELRRLGRDLQIWHGHTYGGGQILDITRSRDGRRWEDVSTEGLKAVFPEREFGSYGVAGDGPFVAVANARNWRGPPDEDGWIQRAVIFRSDDGVVWRRVYSGDDEEIEDVVETDEGFVAKGSLLSEMAGSDDDWPRTPMFWVSADGARWRRDPLAQARWPRARDPYADELRGANTARWHGADRAVVSLVDPSARFDHWGAHVGPPELSGEVRFVSTKRSQTSTKIVARHRYLPFGGYAGWSMAAKPDRIVALASYEYGRHTGDHEPDLKPFLESWTSRDGHRWERCDFALHPKASGGFGVQIKRVITVGNIFVAVAAIPLTGPHAQTRLWMSSDGCHWGALSEAAPSKRSDHLHGATIVDGRLFVFGGRLNGISGMKGAESDILVWSRSIDDL